MTWKEREIYEYDADTLELIETHALPDVIQEGWGLTANEVDGVAKFFVTDGTNNVYQVNPDDWTVEKTIRIFDVDNQPVNTLNDIEFYNGKLLANLYMSTRIGVLDLDSGKLER